MTEVQQLGGSGIWRPTLDLPDEQELALRAKLAAKLTKAYGLTKSVEKDQKHPKHNYKFASVESIYRSAREALEEAGIAILPIMGPFMAEEVRRKEDSNERSGAYLQTRFDFCLVDSETGYTLTLPWVGEVAEFGDKGINKTATSALKYFLRTLLMLPTDGEDDPDRGDGAARPFAKSGSSTPSKDHRSPTLAYVQDVLGLDIRMLMDQLAKLGVDPRTRIQEWHDAGLSRDSVMDEIASLGELAQQSAGEAGDPVAAAIHAQAPLAEPRPEPAQQAEAVHPAQESSQAPSVPTDAKGVRAALLKLGLTAQQVTSVGQRIQAAGVDPIATVAGWCADGMATAEDLDQRLADLTAAPEAA